MSVNNIRDIPHIVQDFNNSIRALITKIERRTKNETEAANLYRLKQRISTLKSTMGEESLVQLAAPHFVNLADKILEPDVTVRNAFFMDTDVRTEYIKRNGTIDKNDEFIFSLTDSIKTRYKQCSTSEQTEIYNLVHELLDCCLEYQHHKIA